jgi:hypothetical protein
MDVLDDRTQRFSAHDIAVVAAARLPEVMPHPPHYNRWASAEGVERTKRRNEQKERI